MSLLEWEPGLSVGVEELDAEHHQLLGLINSLYDAMQLGRGAELLPVVLDGLSTYTEVHFAHEERLMAEHGYPGLAAHATEHEHLIEQVQELRDRYDREGAGSMLSTQLLSFLKNWLLKHIHGTDKLYAPFLNARGVK